MKQRRMKWMMIPAALAMLFMMNTAVHAAPPMPDPEGSGQGDSICTEERGGCRSHTSPELVTLEKLAERDAKAAGGAQMVPALRAGTSTTRTLPLVFIVVGFNGASTNLPDGIAYQSGFDWGEHAFTGEKSLAKYYSDMSLGQFTFSPVAESSAYGVDGNTNTPDRANDGIIHVTLDMPHGTWAEPESDENCKTEYDMISEAVSAASDYMNYAAYDSNRDGFISTDELALCVVVAGYEGATTTTYEKGKDAYLWSHAWSLVDIKKRHANIQKDIPAPDGVYVSNYITISEIESVKYVGGKEVPAQSGLGVAGHELGHYLGLPDLYDTKSTENGDWQEYSVGRFSLMDSGCWGLNRNDERAIFSIDPWCRILLGWITPVVADKNGTYTLQGQDISVAGSKPGVLKIPTGRESDYFLVENRLMSGWDEGLERYFGYQNSKGAKVFPDDGLVVWHIDDAMYDQYAQKGTINVKTHHPAVMVLYPEVDDDNSVTFVRKGRGGEVCPIPILNADTVKSIYPELGNGLKLPLYPRNDVSDVPANRTESCVTFRYAGDDENPGRLYISTAHNPGTPVVENRVEPTTLSVGIYDTVTYCTKCGGEITRVRTTIPRLPSGWVTVDNKTYFYDSNGKKATGWIQTGGKWYYMNPSGVMQKGWLNLGKKWYFLNADGSMKTGWLKSKGKWYFFAKSGVMQTGWVKTGGKWYYFLSSGAMKTGWQKSGGKWYFFQKNGAMKTGWLKSGGKWYFFQKSGAMKTGWLKSGGKWYYFDRDGAMVTGARNVGGTVYRFDSSGACLNP